MGHTGMILLCGFFCIFGICDGHQTYLNVYSSCFESGNIVTEDHVQNFVQNYTVNQPVDGNTSLQLTVCIATEHPDIALVFNRTESGTFDLHTHPSAQFNFSVKGLFVGRTYLQLMFVLSEENLKSPCDAENIKESVVKVPQSENSINLTLVQLPNQQSIVSFHSQCELVVVREPQPIDTVFNVVIVLLVFLINLGLGCKTELSVVKEVLHRPIAPVTGFCSQFIIMPLVSFGAVKVFQFQPALALGFFALGCCPGGSASNAYTYLLDGDVSLSITMTFISTVAALGMIPLWLLTLSGQLYSDASIKIPYQNIFFSLLGLIVPVGIGLLIKHKRANWAEMLVKASKVLMIIFLIFVFTVGVYAYRFIFSLMSLQVLLTAALLPYLGFILGGLVAFAFRLSRPRILTIAIETGIQNTGIAIVMLLLSLKHPESDISITAPIASAIFTPLPLAVAIVILHIRKRCFQTHKAPSQVEKEHGYDGYRLTGEGNTETVGEPDNK